MCVSLCVSVCYVFHLCVSAVFLFFSFVFHLFLLCISSDSVSSVSVVYLSCVFHMPVSSVSAVYITCSRCAFELRVSPVAFTCTLQEVEQLFQSYLRRFSELAGTMINCGSILNWLEVS